MDTRSSPPETDEKPRDWKVQKAALKEKFGETGWNPRKKLSPDAMEGIRALNAQDPDRYSGPVLAEQFKVSPEAIRRILKSKWQPSMKEAEERQVRWDRRGEKIWTQMAELGLRPPKKWREMGVGRAAPGQVPKWKHAAHWQQQQDQRKRYEAPVIPVIMPAAVQPGAQRPKRADTFRDRIL